MPRLGQTPKRLGNIVDALAYRRGVVLPGFLQGAAEAQVAVDAELRVGYGRLAVEAVPWLGFGGHGGYDNGGSKPNANWSLL